MTQEISVTSAYPPSSFTLTVAEEGVVTVSQASAMAVPGIPGPGISGFKPETAAMPRANTSAAAQPRAPMSSPGSDNPRPGDIGSTSVIAGGPGEPELGLIAAGLPRREGGRRVLQATYPGVPGSVGVVRHQAAEALAGVPCAEDAVYALSEVATNAVVHSRSGHDGGEFTVVVDVFPGSQVAFTVTDQGGPWQEGGPDFYLHGLGIVREMAAAIRIDGDQDGRTVRVSFGWEARK
jgi:serine/threonine-protein kinase RsbW